MHDVGVRDTPTETGTARDSLWVAASKVLFFPWIAGLVWYSTNLDRPWHWLVVAGALYLELEYVSSPTRITWTADRLSARWIWGMERSWPIEDVRLGPRASLRAFVLNARSATLHDRRIFFYWPQTMRGGSALQRRLEGAATGTQRPSSGHEQVTQHRPGTPESSGSDQAAE